MVVSTTTKKRAKISKILRKFQVLLSVAGIASIQEYGIGATDWVAQLWWWSVGALPRPGPSQ